MAGEPATAAGERTVRLLLEYDGTPFLGWQLQPQGPTVQSVLEEALATVTGAPARVRASGRTDAGVHALGQVAAFRTASRFPAERFRDALNTLLRPAVAVLAAREAPDGFDPRFDATGKTYRYRVLARRAPSPLERERAWHVAAPLDLAAMRVAADRLVGTRDFSSFRAVGCVASSPIRTLRRCDVSRDGDLVTFELEGDGFLRHMVRNIAGTLVGVGRGRFTAERFGEIVEARDRRQAGRAAPPHGLYLVRVEYPPPLGEW